MARRVRQIDTPTSWFRIKSEGMPDTSKREETLRASAQPERVRARKTDPSALARLFDEWMQGDEAEQRETFAVLRRSLDENREPGRCYNHSKSSPRHEPDRSTR
jgi:hypothetical protein